MKILIIVFTLLLSGCDGVVPGWQINLANKYCEDKVFSISDISSQVVCNDGRVASLHSLVQK